MRQGDILQLRHPPKAGDGYYTYQRVVQAGCVRQTPQKRKLPAAMDGGLAGTDNLGEHAISTPEAPKQHAIFKACVVCFTSSMHTKALKTKLQVCRWRIHHILFGVFED